MSAYNYEETVAFTTGYSWPEDRYVSYTKSMKCLILVLIDECISMRPTTPLRRLQFVLAYSQISTVGGSLSLKSFVTGRKMDNKINKMYDRVRRL